MELIENSDKRMVFEIRNYLVPSPKRPMFDSWSHTRAEFSLILAGILALVSTLFFLKIFGSQFPKGGIATMCFGLSCLLCWPLMFWPDPARVRHRYSIVIDKADEMLLWKRFGWRFGDPLIHISAVKLKEISRSEISVRRGIVYLDIRTNKGEEHQLDMPDAGIAKTIHWYIALTLRNL